MIQVRNVRGPGAAPIGTTLGGVLSMQSMYMVPLEWDDIEALTPNKSVFSEERES